MFTGLVEAKVPLMDTLAEGTGKRMCFDLGPIGEGVRIGDSIALNGCCLTVVEIDGTKCSKSRMVVFKIHDATPFDRIGSHSNNCRVDLRTWPEDAWRQDAKDFAITKALHPNG